MKNFTSTIERFMTLSTFTLYWFRYCTWHA